VILPMLLFESRDLDAIAVHEAEVRRFCVEVALEIMPAFGDGRRITHADQLERAAAGYALGLSQVLKHVNLSPTQVKRRERIKGMLLRGAGELATKKPAFTPGALELVIASSYTLAYPGGVDLYSILPDIYVRPSLRGDAAGFARTVDNMDMYWNDSLEALRRAELLGQLENGTAGLNSAGGRITPSEAVLKDLKEDLTDPGKSHYRRLLVKQCQEWERKEGSEGRSWPNFSRYWAAARGAVQIPEIKE